MFKNKLSEFYENTINELSLWQENMMILEDNIVDKKN
jgi:hypothetical protein